MSGPRSSPPPRRWIALLALGSLAVAAGADDEPVYPGGAVLNSDPVFAALVVTVHELYYADPRSWPGLGYTTHLPGRP